jgi:DNA (cytosine-5)-methyltransferase 1
MENVPDLARTTRFRRFRKYLEQLGYKIEYRIMDAADYGVPQRRKRLVLLAGLNYEIAFARTARVQYTVRSALNKLKTACDNLDPLHDTKSNRTNRIQRLIGKVPKNGGSRTEIKGFHQLRCHKNFDVALIHQKVVFCIQVKTGQSHYVKRRCSKHFQVNTGYRLIKENTRQLL